MTVMENHFWEAGAGSSPGGASQPARCLQAAARASTGAPASPSPTQWSRPALASLARACSRIVIGEFGGWVALLESHPTNQSNPSLVGVGCRLTNPSKRLAGWLVAPLGEAPTHPNTEQAARRERSERRAAAFLYRAAAAWG